MKSSDELRDYTHERHDSLKRIADDARELVVDFYESANNCTFDSDGIFNRLFDISNRIRRLAKEDKQ